MVEVSALLAVPWQQVQAVSMCKLHPSVPVKLKVINIPVCGEVVEVVEVEVRMLAPSPSLTLISPGPASAGRLTTLSDPSVPAFLLNRQGESALLRSARWADHNTAQSSLFSVHSSDLSRNIDQNYNKSSCSAAINFFVSSLNSHQTVAV